MTTDIFKNVPNALREPIHGDASTIISAIVPKYAGDDADISDVINYISGAIRHQTRISIDKDGHPLAEDKSNAFKAKIKRVEEFDRKNNDNSVYGRKAKIVLEAKNGSGDIEEQSIDTEWIEFNGFGREKDESVFSVALANSIKDFAEANIGKEVIVRKGFITGVRTSKGGSVVRFCANLHGLDTSGSTSSSSNSGSGAANKAPASKDDVAAFVKDIKADAEANDLFKKLGEQDQREIPGIVVNGLAANSPVGYIKAALKNIDITVDDRELEDIVADYKKGSEEADFDLFFLVAKAAV